MSKEWLRIPKQREVAGNSGVIRNVMDYFDNAIGVTPTLETPPAEFVTTDTDTKIDRGDLHYKIADVTEKSQTFLTLTASWTEGTSTKTAQTIVEFEVGPEVSIPDVEPDDMLEWGYFQPVDVFVDSTGSFGGVILSDIEENLINPSGIDVAITVEMFSTTLRSARITTDADTTLGEGHLHVSISGLVGNIKATATVVATGTVDGKERKATAVIALNLYAGRAIAGHAVTGATTKGPPGESIAGHSITGATTKGDPGPKIDGTGITGATTKGQELPAVDGTGITGATTKG
ncbi:hypothetical protein F4009_24255, partial [Candidatus Poribacteria bacterium]|nr:hypothetical protein [Candidatus Poribacteria bacterium]